MHFAEFRALYGPAVHFLNDIEGNMDNPEDMIRLCQSLLGPVVRSISPWIYFNIVLWIAQFRWDLFFSTAISTNIEFFYIFVDLYENTSNYEFNRDLPEGLDMRTILYILERINLSQDQKNSFCLYLPTLNIALIDHAQFRNWFYGLELTFDNPLDDIQGDKLMNLLGFFSQDNQVSVSSYGKIRKFYFLSVWRSIQSVSEEVINFSLEFIRDMNVPWETETSYFSWNNDSQVRIWLELQKRARYRDRLELNKLFSITGISANITQDLRNEAETIIVDDIIAFIKAIPAVFGRAIDPTLHLEPVIVNRIVCSLSQDGLERYLTAIVKICTNRLYSPGMYMNSELLEIDFQERVAYLDQTAVFQDPIYTLPVIDDQGLLSIRIILEYLEGRSQDGFWRVLNMMCKLFLSEARYFVNSVDGIDRRVNFTLQHIKATLMLSTIGDLVSFIRRTPLREWMFCYPVDLGQTTEFSQVMKAQESTVVEIFNGFFEDTQEHARFKECARGMGLAYGSIKTINQLPEILAKIIHPIKKIMFHAGFKEAISGHSNPLYILDYYVAMDQTERNNFTILANDFSNVETILHMGRNALYCTLVLLWNRLPDLWKKDIIQILHMDITDPVLRFIASKDRAILPYSMAEVVMRTKNQHHIVPILNNFSQLPADSPERIQIAAHLFFVEFSTAMNPLAYQVLVCAANVH
jgi:hypothetical protein